MNIVMIVYNNLNNDSRVQRSAVALSENNNVTVISLGNVIYESNEYTNIVVNVHHPLHMKKYIMFIRDVLKKLKTIDYDIIYGHDYFSAAIINKLLKKKQNTKFIYDAHELSVPDKSAGFSFRNRIFQYLEKSIICKVDLVICAQSHRAQIMKDYYKLRELPIVIRNISKLPEIDEWEINSNLFDFFSKYQKIIVYAGAIAESRNLIGLIDAVNGLGKDYGLLIIGDGYYLKELNSYILDQDIRNSFLAGSIPYKKLASVLKKCDIGYLYYSNDDLNNKYCAPNKIYEYTSISLPIVANNNLVVSSIFKKSGIGECNENIKEAILIIFNNYDYYLENVEKFNQKEKWENEEKKLKKAVQNLVINGGS